jgi:hypothetical protein
MKHDRAPKEPVQREQPAARSKKPAEHQPAEGWSNPMLRMQRAAGNRSVTAMIETARRAPSQPLDPGTRSYMEPLFRTDLSGVRLYTGDAAAKSARGLGANAYTVGQDIVFGAGSYSPGTVEGRRLLAHELAHTVQQCQPGSGGGLSSAGPGIGIQPKSSLLESEAVCAAGYTGGPVSAGPMALSRAAGLTIARDTPTGAAAPAAQPPAAQPADAGAPPAAAVAAAAPAPRPTAVPAPPLGGAWPEDPEGVYATLEQMVKDRGLEDTKQYVKDYEENAKSATYDVEDTSGASDERNKAKADAARRTTTAGVLNEQLAKIKQRIDEIRPKFKPDVERIAFRRLFENEQYIRKEMEAFGFSLVGLPGADPAKMAGKNQGPKLQETQRLAKQLFQLDRTRTEMRNAIVDMDFGKFDPQVPPPRNKVIQIGDASTWEYLKENWDAASELMGRILNSNPAIFAAWSRGTAADLSAADPTKNPEQMLRTVFDLLDNLHKNIQKAKSNLESEVCDYRDLKPIHQQMAAGLAVASGTKWNEPLAMWVMQDEIGSHAASEAWIKLGLQAAAMIVAITATLATGGAAAFLIGAAASVGAAGGTLIMAENKYASLKIAAASQVKSNEQLVDRAQVREAEAEVEAQRINFAVTAVLALGSHYAGTAVSGAIAQGLFKAAPSALGVGQTLALTVISGTVIGATSSALTTAATEFQRMSRGEITSGEYLSRIGDSWGGLELDCRRRQSSYCTQARRARSSGEAQHSAYGAGAQHSHRGRASGAPPRTEGAARRQ